MSWEKEGIVDLIISFFGLIGAVFHWLVFMGKKKFKDVLEQEIINGIIGLAFFVILILLFSNQIKQLFVYLVF